MTPGVIADLSQLEIFTKVFNCTLGLSFPILGTSQGKSLQLIPSYVQHKTYTIMYTKLYSCRCKNFRGWFSLHQQPTPAAHLGVWGGQASQKLWLGENTHTIQPINHPYDEDFKTEAQFLPRFLILKWSAATVISDIT